MQAIEVAMSPTADNNYISIADWITCINSDHQMIFDFFQNCITQNLILNQFTIVADGISDKTTYYAVDVEKAETFQELFETQALNFSFKTMSMKQFWNAFKFDIDFKLEEIDFDAVPELLDLVNKDTGEIWTTKFPLINPYDNHGNLQ
jgi:hypothetical protein